MRKIHLIPLAAFLCVTHGLCGSTEAAESTAVAAYRGKCLPEDGFDPLTVEFSLAPIDALASLAERLPSLRPTSGSITIETVDAAPSGVPDAPPVLGLTVRPFRLDPADPTRLRVYAEPFHGETVETFREAARAFTEALLCVRIGEHAAAAPAWLLDGLALWVQEGEQEGYDAGAAPTYGWDLSDDELVPGLESGTWTPWRRHEDLMAIRTLIEVGGANAPDRLAASLAGGSGYREGIEAVTGMTWEEFRDRARTDARNAVAQRRTDASAPLLDGWAAARRGEWNVALDRAQEVLGQSDRTLHAEALWLGARALNQLDNPREALKPIEHYFHLLPKGSEAADALIGEDRVPVRHLLGRIHFEHARALHALGDDAGAAESLDQMLLLSPDGEWIGEARRLRAG